MKSRNALVTLILATILLGCATADRAPSPEAKAAMAPTAKLRFGLYLGNPLSALREPGSQELRGAGLDLGRELAQRLGVPFEPVVYPGVGALLEGSKANQWDVALFQISPSRAREFDFSPPIIEIELGYIVPANSRIASTAGADAAGVRIAVAEKGQSDVILTGQLKQAKLVRVPSLAAAIEALKSGNADAIASIKPTLYETSKQFPGSRILDGRFATENIALAMPKGRDAAVPFLREFVEEAKRQGLVKAAVDKAGARGALVAP